MSNVMQDAVCARGREGEGASLAAGVGPVAGAGASAGAKVVAGVASGGRQGWAMVDWQAPPRRDRQRLSERGR